MDSRINKLISWLDIIIKESKPPITKRDERIGRNIAWTILGKEFTMGN